LGIAPSVNAPTLATTFLNESLDLFGPSSSSQLLGVDCGISPPFMFKGFQGVILKRLPKGARSFAASVLQRCIRQLLGDVYNPSRWLRLFQFASCFAQPPRGVKTHNLTSRILAQLRLIDEGGFVQGVPEKSGPGAGRSRRHANTLLDEGEESARRSSIKLADGDICGAVRLLCFADQGVLPESRSLIVIQSKHPPRPPDRRALRLTDERSQKV